MGKKIEAHAHRLVAETAKAQTMELYHELMKNDQLWRAWRAKHPGLSHRGLEKAFLKNFWARALPSARATLAAMLTHPIEERLKVEIHEALCLDLALVRGRGNIHG